MKSTLIAFMFCAVQVMAQQPEKINRLNLQPRETEYYTAQSVLWKEEVGKRPKDASAWENYYWATRYSNRTYTQHAGVDKEKLVQGIVADMAKNVPNTIEYYRCKLSVDGNSNTDTTETLKIIKAALAIAPNDGDVLEEYINYCQIYGHTDKLPELTSRLYNSKMYAYGIMEMNYNTLMSADNNAILFTDGDDDTYPAWMLQYVKGLRTDITVINIPLAIHYPQMMKRLLKEKNIELPDEFLEKGAQATDVMKYIKELVLQINKQYSRIPIFFASTCDVESTFPDSLYCTGLAWRFSTVHIDNMKVLKANVESHFHLDYLNGFYDNGISEDLVQQCNTLYVTPFALLYRQAKNKGDSDGKMDFYKSFVMKYAAKTGKEKEMTEYLDGK